MASLSPLGFVNDQRYIITSAFDGSVLDVKKKRTASGTRVLTWNWNGQEHQMWITSVENAGFRLSPSHASDKTLDLVRDTSKVIIWDFHGSTNQLWNAYLVTGSSDLFFIQNVGSHTVLRNMGTGSQIECVQYNEYDSSAHWRLTPV